jgi:biopolymer transport protein ExbD
MRTTPAAFVAVLLLAACRPTSASTDAVATPSPSGSAGVATILYELPKARTGDSNLTISALTVTLTKDGRAYVNGVELPNDEAIADRGRDQVGKVPRLIAVIDADGAVPYSRVIHAMDLLRQVGIREVAFGVQAVEPPPPVAPPPRR